MRHSLASKVVAILLACAVASVGCLGTSRSSRSSLLHTAGEAAAGTNLNGPLGMAVDAASNMYVADYGGGAVRMFNSFGIHSGDVVAGITNDKPTAVAVTSDGGTVYYTTVHELWRAVKSGTAWLAPQQLVSGLDYPRGVAVDGQGHIFVADFNNQAIHEYQSTGKLITDVVSKSDMGSGNYPTGVAVTQQSVATTIYYTTERTGSGGGQLVSKGLSYDWQTPQVLVSNLVTPQGVAIGTVGATAGHVYVADYGANTVGVYNNAGSQRAPSAFVGSSPKGPWGVAVSADGRIYFTTRTDSKVWSSPFASQPVAIQAGMDNPRGVAVDKADNVYVAANYQIWVFSPSGKNAPSAPSGAESVAVLGDGSTMYLADSSYDGPGIYSMSVGPACHPLVVPLASWSCPSLFTWSSGWPAGYTQVAAGGGIIAAVGVNPLNQQTTIITGSKAGLTGSFSPDPAPQGLTLSSDGKTLYYTNLDGLWKTSVSNPLVAGVRVAYNFVLPRGVAVDNLGNTYVADGLTDASSIKMNDLSGTPMPDVAKDLSDYPTSVATTRDGSSVYFTTVTDGTLWKVTSASVAPIVQ